MAALEKMLAKRPTIARNTDLPELVEYAYAAGDDGDPWDGYLRVKAATDAPLDGARDERRVLLERLRRLIPAGEP